MLQYGGARSGKSCQSGLSTVYVFAKLYGSAFYETLSKSTAADAASAYLESVSQVRKNYLSSFFFSHELECLRTHDIKHL